jgi:choline dehydrogenase-like flavoprotein
LEIFDYVVVGAGSAGCVLANRLSASGEHTVFLLEAGPVDRNIWLHFTLGVGKTIADPSVNWCLQSEPETEAGDRRLAVPRGKVLGGSSSINGGVYVRGNRLDYDGWAQMGCTGWSYDDVLPYFKKAENFKRGPSDLRGGSGPLGVSDVSEHDKLLDGVIAAAESLGYPRNPDINGVSQDGFNYSQTTTQGGWRSSTARAYLKPARNRRNLKVVTGAHVKRVVLTDMRATGIEYELGGETVQCGVRREVILSAGAVHSPAILEHSGIGSGQRLAKLGIPVIADIPNVGENLQDHWAVWMKWQVKNHLTLNERTRSWRAVMEGMKFAFLRKGALTMPAGPMMGFVRTRPDAAAPDVQYHATPLSFENPETRQLDRFPGLTVSALVTRPESKGSIHICSTDALQSPQIRFNAFSAQYDVDTLLASVKIARQVLAAAPLAPFEPVEMRPGPNVATDAELVAYVKAHGNSCYHLAGTCRMGIDPASVIDPQLCVRKVKGLRVADASIMPAIVSGNTNAAAIMIGEKASDLVLADA